MKAVVYHRYGAPDVLRVEDVDIPAPNDDETLVKVCASSVNPVEWYTVSGLFLARLGGGLRRPKDTRLGGDFAGVVAAVGKHVTGLKVGDAVYGSRHGAWAEYVCAKSFIFPKPENITFEQAAGVAVAGVTALQGLHRWGCLQPGQRVLINGASGGVGTFAVQIARALGGQVTAVCSPANLDQARRLGAEQVIDYTRQDFTLSAERFDLLLDIAGSRSFREYRRVLQPGARVVIIGGPKANRITGPLGHVLRSRVWALGSGVSADFFIANYTREDFLLLSEMMACGQVIPVVERVYRLDEAAEALRYLGQGHARGKVILAVD